MQVIDPYGDFTVGRFMSLEPKSRQRPLGIVRQQQRGRRVNWATVEWIRHRFYELTELTQTARIAALRRERDIPIRDMAVMEIIRNKTWTVPDYTYRKLPAYRRKWTSEARARRSEQLRAAAVRRRMKR